jgi:uncharacterized protein DUF3187
MKKAFLLASLFIFFAANRVGYGLEVHPSFGPFPSRTQNPLYLLFLDGEPESTETLERGHFRFGIETVISNLIERSFPKQGVGLDLDMEIYRTALRFSYGFYTDFEAGLEIPFLSFSGGFLDGFLQDYHHAFGFPNGGRDRVPNGRFSYRVFQDGSTIYSPQKSSLGLSDFNFYLKHRFLKEEGKKPGFSLRVAFKIPTGDRHQGLGSGSTDVSLNFALEKSYRRFHSYTNVGYLGLGDFEPLNAFLNAAAVTFAQTFEFNMTSIASVIAQVQGSSPFFHGTHSPNLDRIPLDLNIGFRGTGPRKGSWRHFEWAVALGEDLIPSGPSVDFSLLFDLGAKF